ncbi:MAG: ABC transporter substrate-binding protein [Hydrococcus sp. Prado102]|jgi:multiple sugar transport system substrate-binding protein|nr:ABC transporter substrate-binding protein [Hydrococcus sp. Prado102]
MKKRTNQSKKGVKAKTTLLYCFLSLAIFLGIIFGWIIPALTQQSVTVTVLMHAPEALEWSPVVKEFHQKFPNIRIEIVDGPNDANQREDLYTSSFLLGNSPYDLVFMDVTWTPKFAAAGWLLDVSDRISPQALSAFLDGDVNGGRYQGKLYRIPLRSDAGMLYYRKDLLEQAGYEPPQTFEQLIQISQSLQQKKLAQWGYLWQGKQYEGLSAMFVEILKGYGAFWVDPATLEVGLDRPEAIQAVRFLRSTIEKGISPPGVATYTEEETRLLFQNGQAVFLRNWPYVFSLAQTSEIRGQYAIQPMVHASGFDSGACLGGWGLGIAKTSRHPDEAWKVIEFLTSEEMQRKFILATGKVPSLKSLFNDPAIVAKYPHYPQLLEVIEKATLRPPIAQYAQASDILQRYLSAAITNSMSPEKAMNAAADETRRLLRK